MATWLDLGGKFFNKPAPAPQVADFCDPVQGTLDNCMMVAALSSLTWVKKNWLMDQPTPPFKITFPDPVINPPNPRPCVSRKQYVQGNVPTGTTSVNPGELWPAMLEKMYAKYCEVKITKTMTPVQLADCSVEPNYLNLPTGVKWGGNPVTSMGYFTGAVTANFKPNQNAFSFRNKNSNNCYDFIKLLCDSTGKTQYPMGAWTYPKPSTLPYDATVKVEHSYSLLGWYEPSAGSKNIILRNPNGVVTPTSQFLSLKGGNWNIPDNQYNAGTVQKSAASRVNLPFNSKGIFAVSPETFKTYFEWFGLAYF